MGVVLEGEGRHGGGEVEGIGGWGGGGGRRLLRPSTLRKSCSHSSSSQSGSCSRLALEVEVDAITPGSTLNWYTW